MTWRPGPEPSAGSLRTGLQPRQQQRRLDPGTGRSEQSITNQVSATGIFTGTAPDRATSSHRGTHGDHRGRSHAEVVSPEDFTPGGIGRSPWTSRPASTWTRRTSSSPTRCPTATARWAPPARPPGPTNRTAPRRQATPSPAPTTRTSPGTTAPSSYNVVFKPVPEINDNESATVTLPARMLANYRKTRSPRWLATNLHEQGGVEARRMPSPGWTNDNPVEPWTVGDASQAQGTPSLDQQADQASRGATELPAAE